MEDFNKIHVRRTNLSHIKSKQKKKKRMQNMKNYTKTHLIRTNLS